MIKTEKQSADIDGLTLAQAIQRLKEHIEFYGAEAILEEVTDGYSDSDRTNLNIFVMEPETDSHMAHRIALEEKYDLAREARDREEFERLQKKFGK